MVQMAAAAPEHVLIRVQGVFRCRRRSAATAASLPHRRLRPVEEDPNASLDGAMLRAWEEGGLGGGPAAAAMGGRGTREEDGAEGRRRRHGRAREEEGEWGGGRRHEGGRAVGGRQGEEEKNTGEREREGRMKKIGGQHITAG